MNQDNNNKIEGGTAKKIGRLAGCHVETKKAKAAKNQIRKHSLTFGGSLNNIECMKITGVSRNSFYKYKRELRAELNAG